MDDDTMNEGRDGTVEHNASKREDVRRQEASRHPHEGEHLVVRAASAHIHLRGTPPRPAGTPLTGESPIEWLSLNPRTFNCLMRAGLRRVSDVTSLTDAQVLALRNFSRECLADLHAHLRDVPA